MTYIETLFNQKANVTRLVHRNLLSTKTACYISLLVQPRCSVWIERIWTYVGLSPMILCTESTNLVHYDFSCANCARLGFCSPSLSTTRFLLFPGILISRFSSTTTLHRAVENLYITSHNLLLVCSTQTCLLPIRVHPLYPEGGYVIHATSFRIYPIPGYLLQGVLVLPLFSKHVSI